MSTASPISSLSRSKVMGTVSLLSGAQELGAAVGDPGGVVHAAESLADGELDDLVALLLGHQEIHRDEVALAAARDGVAGDPAEVMGHGEVFLAIQGPGEILVQKPLQVPAAALVLGAAVLGLARPF